MAGGWLRSYKKSSPHRIKSLFKQYSGRGSFIRKRLCVYGSARCRAKVQYNEKHFNIVNFQTQILYCKSIGKSQETIVRRRKKNYNGDSFLYSFWKEAICCTVCVCTEIFDKVRNENDKGDVCMTILGQMLEQRNGAGSEQIKFLLTCPQKPSIITNK